MMNRNVLLGKLSNKDGFEITEELLEAYAFHFQHSDPALCIDAAARAKIGHAYRERWNDAIKQYAETGKPQYLPNGAKIYSTKNPDNPVRKKWKGYIPDTADVKHCLDSLGVCLGMSFNSLIVTAQRREKERQAMRERSGIYND
jgi:ribosomal protein L13